MSDKQIITCPVCNKPLLKISGVNIDCEIEIKCCSCEEDTKIMLRLEQDGWSKYTKHE